MKRQTAAGSGTRRTAGATRWRFNEAAGATRWRFNGAAGATRWRFNEAAGATGAAGRAAPWAASAARWAAGMARGPAMRAVAAWMFAGAVGAAASACASDDACGAWSDCAAAVGDAVCDSGACTDLSAAGARGGLSLTVQVNSRSTIGGRIRSVKIYVYFPRDAGGDAVTCASLGRSVEAIEDAARNPLRVLPVNLESPTLNYFQGLRVAELPAGGGRTAVVLGYGEGDGRGAALGLGCVDGLSVPDGGNGEALVTVEPL